MASKAIVSYIQEQLKKGFNIYQIRQYLLQYGHNTTEIDAAIAYINAHKKDPLVNYIKKQLAAGYDINAIRNYLIQYGYNPQQVDSTISQLQKPTKHVHVVELSKKTMMFVAILIIFVGLMSTGIFFFITHPTPEELLLDYGTELTMDAVEVGDDILFENTLTNMGEKKRMDVTVSYKIVSADTGKILKEWQETKAVDTVNSYSTKKNIPLNTKPGDYYIEGLVTYGDGKKATARTPSFKIYKKEEQPTCFDNIQNQGETDVDCGGPCDPCTKKETCFDGIKNQDETDVDCSGKCDACATGKSCEIHSDCLTVSCQNNLCVKATCDDGVKNQNEEDIDCGGICDECEELKAPPSERDIKDKARQLATSDINAAIEECNKLENQREKEDCYFEAAKVAHNTDACDEIISETKKDQCLMFFVVNENNYEICDKVINSAFRSTCNSLKTIAELKKMSDAGNTEGMMDLVGVEVGEEEPDINETYVDEETGLIIEDIPIEPVIIEGITVDPKSNYAKFIWNTNIAADSVVYYGNTTELGLNITEPDLVTKHIVFVEDLTPNSTYHYKLQSTTEDEEVNTTNVFSFSTKE